MTPKRLPTIPQREIKSPIRTRSQRDPLPPQPQREKLRRINPAHRPPTWRKASNKQIRARNHSFRRRARYTPAGFGSVAHALGPGVVAVGLEKTTVCKHPGHHSQGAEEEGGAAAPAVDEEEGGDGEEDVDYVLDAAADKEIVA